MPDLLFISDNPKVEQVEDLLHPLFKLEIGVTPDLGHALEEIAGRQPAVICIQQHLAGTSAGEIAAQIRSAGTATDNPPPLFVLLHEGNDITAPPDPPFEHIIDLDQPVEELVKSIIRAVLKPAFRLRWNDIYIRNGRDGAMTVAADREATEPAITNTPPLKVEIPADLLKAFERNYHSRHRNRWIRYAAASLCAILAVFGWYLTSDRDGQNGSAPPATPPRPPAYLPATAPIPRTVKSPTPIQKPLTAASVRKTPSVPAVPPAPAKPPAPPAPHAPVAPAKPAVNEATAGKLPSFVPEKGRDTAYSRQKPGWERYTDAKHEFRIRRSGGRIKTIQVLAVTQQPMSDALLKSALKEVTGNSAYRETSRKEEHGFVITRGSVEGGATILIYTRDSRIRAFVISAR